MVLLLTGDIVDYRNKIVLITGASRGIGYQLAHFFAEYNCQLIMTYHTSRNLSNCVKLELENKYHVLVDNIHCDLKKEQDICDLYTFILKKYHKLDILINNAALSLDNDFTNKSKQEFMDVLEVNVVGTFLMIKYMSKIMHKDSYIFNISSTDAIDTFSSLNIDYSASKAALNNMTMSLSLLLKPKIISICPNWVKTESIMEMNQDYLKKEMKRIKQKRLIEPKEIALVIDNCMKNNLKSGSIIRIDGD